MWFNTMGGRTFFEAHVPELIRSLRSIAEALTTVANRLAKESRDEENDLKLRVELLEGMVARLIWIIQSSTTDPDVLRQLKGIQCDLRHSEEHSK
jgi:hypothetical protein